MEFVRGLKNLYSKKKDCVATIGNFDGVHLGHQAILEQLKFSAKRTGLISTVLIFEPQAMEFFSPLDSPCRLTCLREKIQQFNIHKIQRVVCLKFDENIADLSAKEFIKIILVDALSVKTLVVGDDFRFAKNREGNFSTLVNMGKTFDFNVTKINRFNDNLKRVSSTLIREYLATGDMHRATLLLGRPYKISGRVVHGDKRGRKLGFATANIELRRYFSPVIGIFTGRVYGVGKKALGAVIYVGSRPVYKGDKVLLEVHILDFDAELYGQHLQIEFLEKLRGDSNFKSEKALVAQIKKDIYNARISLDKLHNKT